MKKELFRGFDLIRAHMEVEQIAIKNPDGFTVDKYTFEPVENGYAVAVSETQNSFNKDGLLNVLIHAETKQYIDAIGGWLDTRAKKTKYSFDAVIIVDDLQIAAKIAEMNKQDAFYDLTNGETIYLKK